LDQLFLASGFNVSATPGLPEAKKLGSPERSQRLTFFDNFSSNRTFADFIHPAQALSPGFAKYVAQYSQ
jgi:hypothetical protein